jgi:hypothetical protein
MQNLQFVAPVAEKDPYANEALRMLASEGYPTREVDPNRESTDRHEIALFSSREGKFPNKHVRIAPYQFGPDGIQPTVDDWIDTPFQIAVRPLNPGQWKAHEQNRRIALADAARQYANWNPWMSSGKIGPAKAPLTHLGDDARPSAETWQRQVKAVFEKPSFETILRSHLTPVFDTSVDHPPAWPELVVMGCAPFNKPHTDVAAELDPHKAEGVVKEVAGLASDGGFSRVTFVVPRSEFLWHEALRASLHPFLFMDVGYVEKQLGTPFREQTRLWGRRHERTDAEIAETLDAGGDAIERQIVEPLQAAGRCEVRSVSWTDLLGRYLDAAWNQSRRLTDLAERIYRERVQARQWYQTLNRIDPYQGLRRTYGNNAVYLALAALLRDHPHMFLADCEVDEQFWSRLEPVLRSYWSKPPFVGVVPR